MVAMISVAYGYGCMVNRNKYILNRVYNKVETFSIRNSSEHI